MGLILQQKWFYVKESAPLHRKSFSMNPEALTQLRKEFTLHELSEDAVNENPFLQFEDWWKQAEAAETDEINAMTLATAGKDGSVDARVVLLKGFDERGFVFFTNYQSTKSKQLEYNNHCCILFYWKEMERQVRIKGIAEAISNEESIQYFNSRPEGSRIGAWASPQSMAVAGKAWLIETFNYYRERFKHGVIPKPPHWGGYRIKPYTFEFWQGRPSRMHDRIQYSDFEAGVWKIQRLAP